MLRKLEAMRRQSKPVRNRYALYGALLATSVVCLVWFVSLPLRFDPEVVNTQVAFDEQGSFSRATDDIKAQVANIFDALEPPAATSSPSLEEVASTSTENDQFTLDIEAIYNATPTAPTVSEPSQRTVLIGTTSAAARE